nr:MAG TPA: hypothetical protein [Caudoviricetes sp.]
MLNLIKIASIQRTFLDTFILPRALAAWLFIAIFVRY